MSINFRGHSANRITVRLLGAGLKSDPEISLPWIAVYGTMGALREKLYQFVSAFTSMSVQKSGITHVPKVMDEMVATPIQVVQPI